jgi:hypothetical protein
MLKKKRSAHNKIIRTYKAGANDGPSMGVKVSVCLEGCGIMERRDDMVNHKQLLWGGALYPIKSI